MISHHRQCSVLRSGTWDSRAGRFISRWAVMVVSMLFCLAVLQLHYMQKRVELYAPNGAFSLAMLAAPVAACFCLSLVAVVEDNEARKQR